MHTVSHSDASLELTLQRLAAGAVVARVGSYSITGAMLTRFIKAEVSTEPVAERLTPPDFSACVEHLAAESRARGESAVSASRLRRECQARYRAVFQTVLARLIADNWVIGAALELGVAVGDRELRAHVETYRRAHFASQTQFHRFLAGRRAADFAFELQARLAAERVRQAVRSRVPHVSDAQVTRYYAEHRFQYLVNGERDLRIARTATATAAETVRAEIASGKSFAEVVRHLPTRQADYSHEGLVLKLQPHVYGEPKLNEAIFDARPGVLTGPIGTWFGYFVFEVTRVRFEHVRPLAEVQPEIRRLLSGPMQAHALEAYVGAWRATWTQRTDCSPAVVVPGCRQFKGGAAQPQDPLTSTNPP
jgi:hypothetical protein